jgi:hypothetical protein
MFPPDGKPASIAPSLVKYKRGVGTGEPVPETDDVNGDGKITANATNNNPPYPYPTDAEDGNPTVVPRHLLQQFHFTFLIRHPSSSIPSYYRCTVPPLDEVTGFYEFYPNEAGYDELRRLFDFLRTDGQVGPHISGQLNGTTDGVDGTNGISNGLGTNGNNLNVGAGNVSITVVDADDLLDHPAKVIELYCQAVGLEYKPEMLRWDDEENQKNAINAFEKWKGFHEDALSSQELKPRLHVSSHYLNLFPLCHSSRIVTLCNAF